MIRLALIICCALAPAYAAADDQSGLAAQCAKAVNDDTIRPFQPSLASQLLQAYAWLFPQARMPPDQTVLHAGTHIRCMDGRLLACFTGANLPCGKMNIARGNNGADAFCRSNPQAQVVPAFATGHDSAYVYRCVSGEAEIAEQTFPLDQRGFAAKLWTPID